MKLSPICWAASFSAALPFRRALRRGPSAGTGAVPGSGTGGGGGGGAVVVTLGGLTRGITTVDTHLALRAEADADSEILKLHSEQFADLLAGEMLGPRPPRQSTRLKRTVFAFRFSLSFARTQLGNAPCGHALKLPL